MKACGAQLMFIESLTEFPKLLDFRRHGEVVYDTERALYVVFIDDVIVLETKKQPNLFEVMNEGMPCASKLIDA